MIGVSLVALLALTPGQGPQADESKPPVRSIRVTGTSTVDVTPDLLVMSVTVRNANENVDAIADQHLALVERVRTSVQAQQLSAGDVNSSNMAFGENYVRKGQENVRQGYFASSEMTVTVRDLSKYVPLWKSIVKIPGVTIDRVRFEHSNRPRFQEEAREAALRAARQKATAMAAVLNCTVGHPLTVEEVSTSRYEPYNTASNILVPRSSEEVTGSGGKLQIQSVVEITFQLHPPAGK
jgi:uncharacterized protein YggE